MHPSQPASSTAYSEASRRQVNKSGFSTCGLAMYALFDPVPPPPRIRLRTHWRLRIAFHVIGRRASNPRSKRHELGLYRVSDIASFLLPEE